MLEMGGKVLPLLAVKRYSKEMRPQEEAKLWLVFHR
jgi:hypothetical protein